MFWLCVNIKGKFIDFKKWTKKKFKSKLNLNSNLAKEKEEKRGSNSNSFIHSFLTLCLSFWSVFFRFVSFFINLCLKRFNEKKIVHIRIEHCHHFFSRLLLLHNVSTTTTTAWTGWIYFFSYSSKIFCSHHEYMMGERKFVSRRKFLSIENMDRFFFHWLNLEKKITGTLNEQWMEHWKSVIESCFFFSFSLI